MKQLISRRSFLKAAGVTAAAASMAIGAPAASACWFGDKSDVTILYTNDVHTYIDKQSPKLTYAAIADLKQSYQNAGKDVLLVDAGDHVQGTAYGSMDEGASIIKLMNAAGYDVATPGNHEFDYGMDRAKAIMKEADFPYLSCNWVDLRTTLRVLPSVKVFVRGGRRIAFVGVTTPETFTKSTPAYFMDKAQRKYIYDIQGGEDGKKLYDAVQKAIDKAKILADVVIGLGHLGVDPSSSPWTSEEVIAHTSGFDAFIDGHSHTVMENKQVNDASGKAVTLTQTGSYFANVGEMTIAADGTITTKLIPTHEGMDATIAAMQTGWVNTVDDMLGEKIAVGDAVFCVSVQLRKIQLCATAAARLNDLGLVCFELRKGRGNITGGRYSAEKRDGAKKSGETDDGFPVFELGEQFDQHSVSNKQQHEGRGGTALGIYPGQQHHAVGAEEPEKEYPAENETPDVGMLEYAQSKAYGKDRCQRPEKPEIAHHVQKTVINACKVDGGAFYAQLRRLQCHKKQPRKRKYCAQNEDRIDAAPAEKTGEQHEYDGESKSGGRHCFLKAAADKGQNDKAGFEKRGADGAAGLKKPVIWQKKDQIEDDSP